MPYHPTHDLEILVPWTMEKKQICVSAPSPVLSQGSRKIVPPDTKRRLRLSLNSRYDKMIETMCLTRIYPKNKVRKKIHTRPAMPRSGYASDTHFERSSGLEDSVYLTEAIPGDLRSPQESEDFPCTEEDLSIPYSPTGKVSLPGWLAQTFATLPQEHPLRASLPSVASPPSDTRLSSDHTVIETHSTPTVSEQLATISDMDNGSESSTLVFDDFQRMPDCISNSIIESESRSAFQVAENPECIKPFSTPGPASIIFRISTPPRLTFDNLDSRCLQTPFEHTENSDRGSLKNLREAGVEGWQCLSPETDILSPLATPVKFVKLQDFYYSPGPARAVSFTEEVLSFESEGHSKPSLSYHPELTDLDFRWTAFDRKGISSGAGPHNVGPDETRTKLYSNLSALGKEYTSFGRSPSPDDHLFHFQTVLNAASQDNEVEKPPETVASTQELFLTKTNPVSLRFGYDSGVAYCQRLQHYDDTIQSDSDE